MKAIRRKKIKLIPAGLFISILAFASYFYAEVTRSGLYGPITGTKVWMTSHHKTC